MATLYNLRLICKIIFCKENLKEILAKKDAELSELRLASKNSVEKFQSNDSVSCDGSKINESAKSEIVKRSVNDVNENQEEDANGSVSKKIKVNEDTS